MKKYLLVLFLIVFVVPSVTFASWWNPFTWFQKKVVQPTITQVVTPPNPFLKILTTSDSTNLDNIIKDSKPKIITPKSNKTPTAATIVVPTAKQIACSVQLKGLMEKWSNIESISYSKQFDDCMVGVMKDGKLLYYKIESLDVTTSELPAITSSRENLTSLFKDQIIAFKQEVAFKNMTLDAIKFKISDLKDDMANNDGLAIGNPDYLTLSQYIDKLYNNQIDYENKYKDVVTYSINWLQTTISEQETILAQLPSLTTKEQLDSQMTSYQLYKDNLQKEKDSMDSWSQSVSQYLAKYKGIMDGIGSSLKTAASLPVIQNPQPPTIIFMPSSPPPQLNINCVTGPQDLRGEITTTCR